MVVPAGADSFAEALRIGAEVYHALKAVLHERGLATARRRRGRLRAGSAVERGGDRGDPRGGGARGPCASGSPSRSIRRRARSTATALYRFEGRALGRMGCRASGPTSSRATRSCRSRTAAPRTTGTAGQRLTAELGERVQLVGDDLFVTNPERLRRGIDESARQLDPGQGQPDRDADRDARRGGTGARRWLHAVMSHRSGETEDTTIADLAVALGTGQIKTGAPARSDRVAKYNRLLRIEEELGATAPCTRAGRRFRA